MTTTRPRTSTLILAGLLLALFTTTPVPLAVVVTVWAWLLHSHAALLAGIAITAGWKVINPKAVR
jgi:hypothetical protein